MNFANFSSYVAREENDEKARILEENMSSLSKESFFVLHIWTTDDDAMHIKEHTRFIAEHRSEISQEGLDLMKAHIREHAVQASEKQKMGIVIREADKLIDNDEPIIKTHVTQTT